MSSVLIRRVLNYFFLLWIKFGKKERWNYRMKAIYQVRLKRLKQEDKNYWEK